MGSDAMVHGSISDLVDDARYGSNSEVGARNWEVRSAPVNGHRQVSPAGRFVPWGEHRSPPIRNIIPGSGNSCVARSMKRQMRDDVVVLHDGTGKPTGKRRHFGAGEDPRGVAYRLTRDSRKAKASDFNRPLNYRPLGNA